MSVNDGFTLVRTCLRSVLKPLAGDVKEKKGTIASEEWELAEGGWSPACPPLTPARSTWAVLFGSFGTAGAAFTLQSRRYVK